MKALVGAFNQEKALVGAFSVIVQPVVEPMEHYTALVLEAEDEVAAAPGHLPQPRQCVLAIFIPGVLKWKECATCVNSNMFK